MTPSADFTCPGCKQRTTLYWNAPDGPPQDEGCTFCITVEPLRRDWSPFGVGALSAGQTPARPSRVPRPSRVS